MFKKTLRIPFLIILIIGLSPNIVSAKHLTNPTFNLSKIIIDKISDEVQFYNEGKRTYELQVYDSAIIFFTKAIALNPKKAIYYGYRGASEGMLKKYVEALSDLDKAIELDNHNSWLYYERGQVQKRVENFKAAIADYTKSIIIDSVNYDAIYARGFSNRKLGNYNDGLKDLDYLITKSPNKYWQYYFERGQIYFGLTEYAKAISDFNVCLNSGQIKQKEIIYAALFKRGVSYAITFKSDSAIADLQMVNKREPLESSYKYLGLAYQQKGDSVRSRECFIKSIVMNPKTVDTYFYYGRGEYYFGNCKKALELYTKGEKLASENQVYSTDHFRYRGLIKGCLNDTAGALEDFKISIKLDSNNYSAYVSRIALLHSDVQYLKQTREDIEQLIKIFPDKKQLTFLYTMDAIYSVYIGDTIQAEKLYKKAIENAHEKKGYTYYNLAAYYFYFRNRVEYRNAIIESLQKSIAIQKDKFDAYKLLVIAYTVIDNDADKGCETIKKAEKQFENTPEIKKMKSIACNGKAGKFKEIKCDYITISDDELLKPFSGAFSQPPNAQLTERIVSLMQNVH